jgi:hypothetical protein
MHTWEDNIKRDLKRHIVGGCDRINLALNRIKYSSVTAMTGKPHLMLVRRKRMTDLK